MQTYTDSRHVTWRKSKDNKWEIVCRICKENKADYFDIENSKFDKGKGWADEWHICKKCFTKEQIESFEKYKEKKEREKERRWKEYCEYMDHLMEGVE